MTKGAHRARKPVVRVDVRNDGFGNAVFDLFDVTGVGRQFLEMQTAPTRELHCVRANVLF
jgi:hypothetical protein